MRPEAKDTRALLAAADVTAEVTCLPVGQVVRVEGERVLDALAAFRTGGYESLVDFDGTDTGSDIELTYKLRSYSAGTDLYIKTTLPYDGTIHSAWNTYPSVLMPERETAELFGLHLAGHPNPKRLLTTDGIAPLLRKDVSIRTQDEVRRT